MRSLEEIRERIDKGNAVILTAEEFKRRLKADELIEDVDVITCGTCGVMSGTYAVLSIPVAAPGSFLRADTVSLNGVPAIPGPCPNERLGLIDLIVYGTAHAGDSYGGGHLFQDIIADHEIRVSVTAKGKMYERSISGHSMPHARLFTTRSAFKNYTAIINSASSPEKTIFSVIPLAGEKTQVTVSGCGEINPIQNDPDLRFLTPGTQILLNGGLGYVIGQGTRSSIQRPNIAVHGEMSGMDPSLCGGFKTSAGPECLTSIGTAIPVLDPSVLSTCMIQDKDIPLPVMDISDRQQIALSSYDQVWSQTSRAVRFESGKCLHCNVCKAETFCPVDAITPSGEIDHATCFCCGTCVHFCEGSAYLGNFGELYLPYGKVPIVLRQSDRSRGNRISQRVKKMISDHEFQI